MDRAEKTGLGISAAGHLALFAALSLGLAVTRLPPPPAQPIEVSFEKDVGLTNAAPNPSPAPPAQSQAPEAGAPEEAAPPPVETAKPQPTPAPPPAETPRPAPQKAEKPQPAKAQPAKPTPAKPAAHAAPTPAPARPAPAKAAHEPRAGTAVATRGTLLGHDFLKGIGSDPTPSKSQQAQAAVTGAARASIAAAIMRQVKPCADRMVNPGPGANRIRVTIALKLNRDGSLRARPTVEDAAGVDDENRRYVERVKDMAVATFVGCSPLHDLPPDLYDVPQGWSDFALRYNLP
ncbi:MAG TPA: cell envelope biogenesis protein TolA [Allosphingosinicella sp.]|jgi:outer membrane biosynthesis protein TonB|nr:cell envelope biogenesis protein TolA [Allosphingosinicella sp.]